MNNSNLSAPNLSTKDIKVSIICEVYNHEKYLRKCLDSLINQETDFDYEIIINDDCSTDNSANIIREYEEKFPQLIVPVYQEENLYSRGINIPFEIMIPRAKGEYIAFCEGDDYWTSKKKLQKQFDSLKSNNNCAMSVHKVTCVSEDGNTLGKVIPSQNIEKEINKQSGITVIPQMDFARLVFCGDYPFHTTSYFLRKDLFTKVINNDLPIGRMTNGDYIALYLGLIGGDVVYIDEELSAYRMASIGSWSNSHPKDEAKEVKVRFDRAIKSEEEVNKFTDGKFDELIKASVARYVLAWSDVYPKEAKKILKSKGVTFKNIRRNLKPKYSVYYVLLYTIPVLHTAAKKLIRSIRR